MGHRTRALSKWFVRIWGAAAIAFGAAFAIVGALDWDRAADSVGWPTVAGTVVSSRVEHSTTHRRGRTTHSHSAHVSYRYAVAGRALESSRIGFRMHGSTESEARAIVERYPGGASVTVHHSPDDPTVACLEPGTGDLQWLPLAIGAFCVVMGAGIAWFVPRMIDARAQAAPAAE
jgi:hypothetical protein